MESQIMSAEEFLKTQSTTLTPILTPKTMPENFPKPTEVLVGGLILIISTVILLAVLPFIARYLGYLVRQFKKGMNGK